MANPLRVTVADLLRRPGSERQVHVTLTPAELGVTDERFDSDEPVEVDLRLESLTDGVVVAGQVGAIWHGICRRCAEPATGRMQCSVRELYQLTVTDPDAFLLEGDQLDLEPMVREVIVLDAPVSPLCRDECAGLCQQCGADLNVTSCGCVAAPVDQRWSALDDLKATLEG
ncbi:MAG: hypothetical protein RI958_1566 [Actinomycetota bacterium]|jgi:uncharacterized protein